MRAAQLFPAASPLAAEIAKPHHARSILSQPDMLVPDLRAPATMPAGGGRPIAVITPENLVLASRLLPLMSIYLMEDMLAVSNADGTSYLSRISPCLTWCERWQAAIFKLAPPNGASLEVVRNDMQDALAREVAPAFDKDGMVPKTLSKISWQGRWSLHEFIVLLRASPTMINNLELVGSMQVELKFVESDGETYSSRLLVEFIGTWLLSASRSDSAAAGKRRLHDPPGTHGYTAIVPMTGRKPYERLRYDIDTGRYTFYAAAAHYTAAGSYAGGGAFPFPKRLGLPKPGMQWTYSLIEEKHVAIPKVKAGELPRAPQDTPSALQAKVARGSRPLLSRFFYGVGRSWDDSRRARLADPPASAPGSGRGGGSGGGGGGSGSVAAAAAEEPEEEPATDPTVGVNALVGERLRARDAHGKWYTARVEAADGEGAERQLLLHFMGWNPMWDEWVQVGTGRLKPLQS